MNATAPSVFENVQPAPPDAILGLNTQFRADPSPSKVNLGVGAYRTAEGLPYVLPVVRRVEQKLANDPSTNHEYLPQDGLSSFTSLSAQLILGSDSPAIAEDRTVTLQSLSGTGALKLCLTFASNGHFSQNGTLPRVYIPQPTWPNHQKISISCGLDIPISYRYFEEKTGGVDINGLLTDLSQASAGSIIILHACAHNPTGADLTNENWQSILNIVKERSLIPLFDSAYQGFASGDLDEDAYAIRLFASQRIDMFVAQSFAKNMGLYGERVGALTVICKNRNPIDAVKSQLNAIVRSMYSSPPSHGARIVSEILSNPAFYDEWKLDLKKMSNRISKMRLLLRNALECNGTPGSWDHITTQIGMFSFTRLTKEQVLFMQEKRHIYMTLNGRISMAGLTEDTIDYVAGAMRDAIIARPIC